MFDSAEDFAQFLALKLKKAQLVFFTGAGISKDQPANLPLAFEFNNSIFEYLCTSQHEKQTFLKEVGDVRPEVLLHQIGISVGREVLEVLNILKNGRPNLIHHFLAVAMSKSWLKTILTTNFDCLIEKACESIGTSIIQIASANQFEHFGQKKSNECFIFKIHGSIEDLKSNDTKDSIQFALRDVAYGLTDEKVQVLKYYLNSYTPVFLGYSGLDDFDIHPILSKEISNKILWVHHTPEEREFRVFTSIDVQTAEKVNKNVKKVIESTNGILVICHTKNLVKRIWQKLFDNPIPKLGTTKIRLRPHVKKWAKSINLEYYSDTILARLIQDYSGSFEKAIYYLERSMAVKGEAQDEKGLASVINDLGTVWYHKKDYDMAIKHYEWSLRIREMTGDEEDLDESILGNLANIYQDQGKYDKAIGIYEKILDIHNKKDDEYRKMLTLHHLGIAYGEKGESSKAIDSIKNSLEYAEEMDVPTKAACLGSIGRIYLKEGMYNEAIQYFKESLRLYEALGFLVPQCRVLGHLANAFAESGQYTNAFKHYKKCKIMSYEIGDEDLKQELLNITKKNLKIARSRFEKSKE